MSMHEDVFLEIGLTPGETRVYLSLFELGQQTVGPVAKHAKVSLSKIYEILDHLMDKGLVSVIRKNNVKHFSAAPPQRILDYLDERQQVVEVSKQKVHAIIPSLQNKGRNVQKTQATLYEGYKGIQSFYEMVIAESQPGDEVMVMGIPLHAAQRYEGYFLDWNARRAQKNVSIKIIFDEDVKKLGVKRSRINLTAVRYLPKKLVTPAWILVYRSGVATIHMTDNPICVIVQDQHVVASYKAFFDLLWKQSST